MHRSLSSLRGYRHAATSQLVARLEITKWALLVGMLRDRAILALEGCASRSRANYAFALNRSTRCYSSASLRNFADSSGDTGLM